MLPSTMVRAAGLEPARVLSVQSGTHRFPKPTRLPVSPRPPWGDRPVPSGCSRSRGEHSRVHELRSPCTRWAVRIDFRRSSHCPPSTSLDVSLQSPLGSFSARPDRWSPTNSMWSCRPAYGSPFSEATSLSLDTLHCPSSCKVSIVNCAIALSNLPFLLGSAKILYCWIGAHLESSCSMRMLPLRKPGPKPDVLKVDSDWQDAVKKSLTKKKAPKGWTK